MERDQTEVAQKETFVTVNSSNIMTLMYISSLLLQAVNIKDYSILIKFSRTRQSRVFALGQNALSRDHSSSSVFREQSPIGLFRVHLIPPRVTLWILPELEKNISRI